jgi:hypothetical protein
MPGMLGGVASGAVIEAVVRGSNGKQDGSFPAACAHFDIILA